MLFGGMVGNDSMIVLVPGNTEYCANICRVLDNYLNPISYASPVKTSPAIYRFMREAVEIYAGSSKTTLT